MTMRAPSFTEVNVASKRASILKATLDLISERGFHNTPITMIAKQAGVSSGIIYYYFENKEALIYELYKDIKLKLLRAAVGAFSEQASYRERFLAGWKRAIRYYIHHPKEIKFLEQFENSPYAQPDWQEMFSDEIRAATAFFQQGIQEGVLKDFQLEVSMGLGFGVALLLAKQHIRGEIDLTDELIDAAADASWDAIKK
jgi:AcrR family transcriptional regulator